MWLMYQMHLWVLCEIILKRIRRGNGQNALFTLIKIKGKSRGVFSSAPSKLGAIGYKCLLKDTQTGRDWEAIHHQTLHFCSKWLNTLHLLNYSCPIVPFGTYTCNVKPLIVAICSLGYRSITHLYSCAHGIVKPSFILLRQFWFIIWRSKYLIMVVKSESWNNIKNGYHLTSIINMGI